MRATFACATLTSALLISVHAAESAAPHVTPPPAATATSGYKNVTPQDFDKLRRDKKNVVLDVRTPKEYAAGHIPGSVNIDFNAPDFDKKIAALDTNKTYLVHCAIGGRSAKACDKLSKLRFPNVYNLDGGMKAWEKAGNKAER